MKTVFGSLYHAFATANKVHLLWCAGLLMLMLILAILHHRWRDEPGKLTFWRFLCLLPAAAVIAHYFLYVHGAPDLVYGFIYMYAIAVLALILMPFAKRRIGYRIAAVPVALLTLLAGFLGCGEAPNFYNFSKQSYTESFRSLMKTMDSIYILKEWKNVDFAALEAKYLPMVQEAENEQDPAKFTDAVALMSCELHDGHVSVAGDFDGEQYKSALDWKDYGIAAVQLDSGEVIAVCTSADVQALGITDGTVLTKWNGKPIMQAAQEDVTDDSEPVLTNGTVFRVMAVCGTGGDTVDVSYLDKDGAEQTVTLTECSTADSQPTVMTALYTFAHFTPLLSDADYQAFLDENYGVRMLNDKCGYLRLNAETTGNNAKDILGYLTGDQKWSRERFREGLRSLKEQGMEYLVVDLRCNIGGFDEVGCALCDLLTTEDWYGQGLGVRKKDGSYVCVSDHGIHGDGEFADLPVLALTNLHCISAGDGTSLYLSKLPNVTLAGITNPCGCNQETGGMCVLSGGTVTVRFPTGLILDEKGVPNVDTRADRVSRNPVEEHIPLDYDAAMKIFSEKQDYELDWAISYLEEHS